MKIRLEFLNDVKSPCRFVSAATRERRVRRQDECIFMLLLMIPMNDARVNVTRKKEAYRRVVMSKAGINKRAFVRIEICIAHTTDTDCARTERIYVNSRI